MPEHQAGKSSEVPIEAPELGAVLNGDGGEMRVGGEVPAGPGLPKQQVEHLRMTGPGCVVCAFDEPSQPWTTAMAWTIVNGLGNTGSFVDSRRNARSATHGNPTVSGAFKESSSQLRAV